MTEKMKLQNERARVGYGCYSGYVVVIGPHVLVCGESDDSIILSALIAERWNAGLAGSDGAP